MIKLNIKNITLMALCTLALAACSGSDLCYEEPEQQRTADLTGYQVIVNATVGGQTRMNPETGAWQDGDEIYIALDGTESNCYTLKYSASSDKFTIFNLNSAAAGFAESGTVTGLYASKPDLSYDGTSVKGTTMGDAVFTTSGNYSKEDKTITITMNLSERRTSLIKITGLESEAYVSNMKSTFTKLTQLSTPTWEADDTTPSYIYSASEKATYCYGEVPADEAITLTYTNGLIYKYTGTLPSLAAGEMTEVASPDADASKWAIDETKYYATGSVITYNQATSSKAFTLVVVPEGYQQKDFLKDGGQFEKDATAAMNTLFSVEPYNRLKPYMNVYFIAAVSKDAGADIYTDNTSSKTIQTERDTYFNVGWGPGDINYSYMGAQNESDVYNFASTYCPDLNGTGSFSGSLGNSAILVLINDTRYGGICHFSSSGRSVSYVPTFPRTRYWSNAVGATRNAGTWLNIVVHEFGGHGIGRATDEYIHSGTGEISTGEKISLGIQHAYSVPFAKNLTLSESSYDWSWMADQGYSGEGLYEGGNTYETGVWRAEPLCCMADNRLYFNAWIRYLIEQRIYGVAGVTFNQSVFTSHDSKISSYTDATTGAKPQWGGYEGDIEVMPMTAPPVVTE